MSKIKVYYWPFLARGASLIRMLEHTGTPYEYISDKAEMAKYCSAFGAEEFDTFAPPVVVDGDMVVGQSIASCLYLGKKLGLTPAAYNEYKAMQSCSDIVDVFEGNLGKKNEDGPTLKEFLEGSRWKALMCNLERGIAGPFYFGDSPSAVDFFLLQHLDWRSSSLFDPLKSKYGVDAMAPYPKMLAIQAALRATDAYKNYKALSPMGPIKDEILAAFAP